MMILKPLICIIASLTATLYSQGQNCVAFDGSSQLISSNSDALNTIGDGDFTFEAWVNGEVTNSSQHPIIFSNRATTNIGTKFYFHDYWGGSNGKMLCVQLNAHNYILVNNGTYNGEILDGKCHHVAIARSGKTLTFYVDGESFGTRTINGQPSVASPQSLWIGQDHVVNSTFNGSINNLKIWDIALTEQEIKESSKSNSLNNSHLIAFWKLNKGSGQTVLELVNGNSDQLGTSSSNDSNDPSWNGECCVSNSIECEVISGNYSFEMPNVFTPNADNSNDVFVPRSIEDVEELNCVILNRWGQNVFETNDLTINWDGGDQPDGVYFYLVKLTTILGENSCKQGFFHLIR